jgi:hypothetical protein
MRTGARPWEKHRLVFICGLHRSGTTLLGDVLATSPDVSGFRETGIYAREGQHIQSVYPIEDVFGGPGRMGFRPEMHMTEQSSLATEESRERLFMEWSSYWDLKRPVLIEKTPANLLKARFLQALYPTASFILITRHPVATVLATQKWSHTGLHALFDHWFVCHELFQDDQSHLQRVTTVTYEQLTAEPEVVLRDLAAFLEIEPWTSDIRPRRDVNEGYFREWRRLTGKSSDRAKRRPKFSERLLRAMLRSAYARLGVDYVPLDLRAEAQDAMQFFEARARRFGYSLTDL